MAVLKFRVDDRLIHGQITAKWLRAWDIAKIVIVDTPLSQDALMKQIYLMAAPVGIEVSVLSSAEAIEAWGRGETPSANTMALFKDVMHVAEIANAGVPVDEVQLGNLSKRPGSSAVGETVFLNEGDRALLRRLLQKNTAVFLQTLPGDEPLFMSDSGWLRFERRRPAGERRTL
ncbi:MAG: PTS sugar transporter subunit IIB [Clostridiales Family XIII bacterium]|jgi:PTS system mannose-specific IIB component|nr:PTS sugar transporter subunit IIB [Clostridiales Family XIII bacterium]